MTGLGDLPGGPVNALAAAVSADGRVVAGQGWSARGFEAFVWRGGELLGLGSFPEGGFSSEAFAISADGAVVVGRSNGRHGSEAFRWIAPP
jgi:probable HAF family extracellular repeat protein